MKIYSKLVFDIETGKMLEEKFEEYSGPIAECGGGSSGEVDFPNYMKNRHTVWLEEVAGFISGTTANNPYDGETAYDPDTDIAQFLAILGDYDTLTHNIDPMTIWADYTDIIVAKVDSDIINEASLAASTLAHAAVLDDRLTTEILPRFETGMRDINAVISSSFVTGKAIIEGFGARDVANYDGGLRVQSYGQRNKYIISSVAEGIRALQLEVSSKDGVTRAAVDSYRTKYVMKKEEIGHQLDIDDRQGRWPLEMYQYGNNVMSSISGAALPTGSSGASTVQSTIGGISAGASIGGEIGGGSWQGYVIGGVVGGIAGYLSNS